MPRRRRSSDEVRELLLDAAVTLFAERGYAGATTRAIAEQAGVSETLVFRSFGGKEALFQAAVVQPVDAFLEEYTKRWLEAPLDTGEPEEMMRSFVEGLYGIAREHRALLLAADGRRLAGQAQAALGRLERMASEIAALHGYAYEPAVAIRAAVAMVLGLSLFEDEAFAGSPPERELVIGELTAILLRGLARSA